MHLMGITFSYKYDRKTNIIRLSHDGVTIRCWSQHFDFFTASLHQAMRFIVYELLYVARWLTVIGTF